MIKRLSFFLALFILLLAACASGKNIANDNNASNNSNNTANNNNNPTPNDISSDDQVDSSSVPAQCTAQSAKAEDVARPGDWIKGATEDYAVTIVEYGDFQ